MQTQPPQVHYQQIFGPVDAAGFPRHNAMLTAAAHLCMLSQLVAEAARSDAAAFDQRANRDGWSRLQRAAHRGVCSRMWRELLQHVHASFRAEFNASNGDTCAAYRAGFAVFNSVNPWHSPYTSAVQRNSTSSGRDERLQPESVQSERCDLSAVGDSSSPDEADALTR